MGNTSFSGVSEMFGTPEVNESQLYADIPDTPNGPNEMFVSPLSSRRSRSSKKSLEVQVLRKSVGKRKSASDVPSSSSKRTPRGVVKRKSSPLALSGVKKLFKTPKVGEFNSYKSCTDRIVLTIIYFIFVYLANVNNDNFLQTAPYFIE